LRLGTPHVAQQLHFELRSIQENIRRDAPLARQAMSGALKGTRHRNGKVKTPGICELLGLAPFTPHDLRRTAATMCGNLGLSESAISLCLDHQATKGSSINN
jgi:integrase